MQLGHLARPDFTARTSVIEPSTPAELRRLSARRAALAALGPDAVQTLAPDMLRESERLLATSRHALSTGQQDAAARCAAEGDRVLRDALLSARHSVADHERVMTTRVLAQAVGALGFRVRVEEVNGRTGIWAEREHQIIAAAIEPGGRTMVDLAGCESGTCMPLQSELEQELHKRGALIEDVRTTPHDNPRGGVLIQCTRGAADPARAIAQNPIPQPQWWAGDTARQQQANSAHQMIGGD